MSPKFYYCRMSLWQLICFCDHRHRMNPWSSSIPGPSFIKLFAIIVYEYNKIVFVPGRPFQPGLMNVVKARNLT
jgi:hypothetical protein